MEITDNGIYIMTYTDYLLIGLQVFFIWAKWFLLLAFILTVVDLYFGVLAAKYRGERIRKSRALKRTMNKICSDILWIIVAYAFGESFGKSFDIELIPCIMLLVIYGMEIESIYSNYFESRGIKAKINFLKFFGKKTDIIEIEKEKENETKQ